MYSKFLDKKTPMPRKYKNFAKKAKRTKKGVKRKGAKRYRRAKNTATLIAKPAYGSIYQPFPPRFFTALTYSHKFTLGQLVGGVPAVQTFRANSLFDPDQTGIGHQPRYFDSLCGPDGSSAPYHNYRVHAAKIKLIIWSISETATSAAGLIAIIPRQDTASTVDSFDEMSERAYSKTKPIATYYNRAIVKMSHFVKNKVLLGHKDLQDVDECAGTYAANPSEQVLIDVVICAADNATTLGAYFTAQITYFTEFYGLTDVADS